MRISELGEFNLIDRLKRIVEEADAAAQAGTGTQAGAAGADDAAQAAAGVVVGIGDDAAVLQTDAGHLMLLTTDIAVEGVHFRLHYPSPWSPPAADIPELIGYRIMVSNVSDIAAMAGVPRFAVVTLTAPPELDVETVDGIYRGLARAGRKYSVEIVGGDCSTGADLALGVALAGTVEPDLLRRRSDAQAGDVILVTGPVGASAAGLEILMREAALPAAKHSDSRLATTTDTDATAELTDEIARQLIDCHLAPRARVEIARAASRAGAHAMEDVSDGVAAEVRHIAEMSGLSATIESHRVPIHPIVIAYAAQTGADPLDFALGGGEDYELVITAPQDRLEAIQEAIRDAGGYPAVIGRMHEDGKPGEVVVVDAGGNPLAESARGYEHFRNGPGGNAP